MRKVIITESQYNKLLNEETINQVVLNIKNNFLDPYYKKGIEDGTNKKVIGVIGKNNKGENTIVNNITPEELFYTIEDKVKNIIPKGDKRNEFIKQVIIDWFNNSISKEGNLSKNLTI